MRYFRHTFSHGNPDELSASRRIRRALIDTCKPGRRHVAPQSQTCGLQFSGQHVLTGWEVERTWRSRQFGSTHHTTPSLLAPQPLVPPRERSSWGISLALASPTTAPRKIKLGLEKNPRGPCVCCCVVVVAPLETAFYLHKLFSELLFT